MAILAGNLGFKMSVELRSRVLLIPWFKKSSFTRCCADDYPSSGPIRYVPKKNDPTKPLQPSNNSQNTEHDHTSDSIPSRNKVSERRKLSLRSQNGAGYISKPETFKSSNNNMIGNVEREFMGWEDDEGGDYEPEDGSESFEEEDTKICSKSKEVAERLAIEALATRAFTAVELRKKLQRKNIPLNIIDSVLTDFQNRGLINDYLYAESFSQSRWSSSSWGPRRIKQALVQKGVSEADVKKAMKHVFEGDESDVDKETNLGMSKLSMDRLFVQASKQWLRGQDVPLEKRKSRIVRWLQYRGFNWGVTSFILKKLESQYPP